MLAVAGDAVDDVEIEARVDGAPVIVNRGGCPTELPRSLTCSYTVSGRVDGEVEVTLSVPGREPEVFTVEPAAFNYCARDIAYVEIDVGVDETVIYDMRYVSPCNLAALED